METYMGLLSSGQIPYFADELAGQIFLALVQKEPMVTHKKLDDMICNAISMAERMDAALVARHERMKEEE